MKRIHEISRKRNAIATLTRFCNNVVKFYLQTHRSRSLKDCESECECGHDANPVTLPTSNNKEHQERDSFTNHNDISTSSLSISSDSELESSIVTSGNVSEILSIHNRQMEMYLMGIEDELSRQLVRIEQNHFRDINRKKMKIVEEIMRRYEFFCMSREDRYSNAFRKEDMEKIYQRKLQLQIEKKSNRDTKTSESIKKETDRLLQAKLRSKPKVNQLKKSKRTLMDRSSRGHLYKHKPMDHLESKENIEHLFTPYLLNDDYNKKLVRRRESRLLRQVQAQREMEESLKQLKEQNKLKQSSLINSENNRRVEILEKVGDMVHKRKVDRDLELLYMQQNLHSSKSSFADEGSSYPTIRSVSDWSRELM